MMKKKLILPALLLQAAVASAQYSIEVKPFETIPGIVAEDAEYMEICINYGAEEKANMAQFNITLPQGMTLDEESGAFELDATRFPTYKVGRQENVQPFTVNSEPRDDGSVFVTITTQGDYWIMGNSGTCLRAYYLTAADMQPGEYEVKIENGVIAIPAAEGNGPADLSSTTKVTVKDDAVGISSHTVASATTVAVYSIDGRRKHATAKGLSIVRKADGTVKKVMR